MSVDTTTRYAGQPGSVQIFNRAEISKLSNTGPDALLQSSVDRFESGIDASKLSYRKGPDEIMYDLEVERAQKHSIFEQFDQNKNNKLLNSYNYQGIQQDKLQNRK